MQAAAPSPGFTSEIKFLVNADTGGQIREWVRARLAPDPHGAGPEADEYRVSSLYFDTPGRDVFHRRGSYGRSKYRVRRYHEEPSVFLERKLRTGSRLSKRRTSIDLAVLPRLAADEAIHLNGTAWFLRRVAVRRLQPVCQVSYQRIARMAETRDGAARVTLDRAMRGIRSDAFSFDARPVTPLLEGAMILELKYRQTLPAVFKQLVEEFSLRPQRSSKYRVAADVLGLIQEAREDAPPFTVNA